MQFFLDWFEGTVTGINEPGFAAGKNLSFNPNPFQHETSLNINLPADSEIDLKIVDLRGKEVRIIHSGRVAKGTHTYVWDGTSDKHEKVNSGVYFGVLNMEGRVFSEKIIILNP
jgi:flagellar hook assembly protein FlgD